MRLLKAAVAAGALASATAANATTVIVFVDPMTMQKHMRVLDTPGPDRVLMCVQPPAVSGCTEISLKKAR